MLDAQYPGCTTDPCTSIPGDTASSFYWSSPTHYVITDTAWYVNFVDGSVGYDVSAATSPSTFVRCAAARELAPLILYPLIIRFREVWCGDRGRLRDHPSGAPASSCSRRLAPIARFPEHLVLGEDFPRVPSGKVRKEALREEARRIAKGDQS